MTGVVELTMTDDLAALRPGATRRLDAVTVRALDLVVDAHGDLDVWYAIGTGALEGRRSAVTRFAGRAGVELVADHVLDDGLVAVPASEAVELCQAYCRRERLTVRRVARRVELDRLAGAGQCGYDGVGSAHERPPP